MSSLVLFVVAIALLALFGDVFRSRKTLAEIKDSAGETKVAEEIARIGIPSLHDVYLPSSRGTTQIDHIVKIGNAIVVMETKAWSGFIYGKATDKKWWRRSFGRGMACINPIAQNAGHISAVRHIVGSDVDLRGLVVMAADASFPRGAPAGVVTLNDLAAVMRLTLVDAGRVGSVTKAWEKLVEVVEQTNLTRAMASHLETLDKTVPERRIAIARAKRQKSAAVVARKPGRIRIEDRVEPTF